MTNRRTTQSAYVTVIEADPDRADTLRFVFASPSAAGNGKSSKPSSTSAPLVLSVQGHGARIQFTWVQPPADIALRSELEDLARKRVSVRQEWLGKLEQLVSLVKGWAEEFDWSTKLVTKKLTDEVIGEYRATGLLMQQETIRLFLEPVTRSAPGTEGVVDLYLMPSYDDIASLCYYNHQWNIHYLLEGTLEDQALSDTEGQPLSKETLREVLDEMKAHAG